MLLLLMLSLALARAAVIELNISPSNPYCGDTVVISGKAQPNEKVTISSSFKKTVGVENGKYVYRLYGIYIPPGENSFTVVARNSKNLQVSVRIVIWFTKGSDAVNGTAVISQSNVPEGTYDIKIYGDAADGAREVELDIEASKPVSANSEGKFELSVQTNGIPAGLFKITAGGIERIILLSERPTPTPVSNGIWITPTPTSTSTPTPTSTATPMLTPVETPGFTPTPTINFTPTPTSTPTSTPISTPTAGFEVFLALLAIALIFKLKR